MTVSLDWLFGRPIAHRGLHGQLRAEAGEAEIPENSLAAFAAAVADGYGGELDVQASADGRAMVFHDWRLSRMTGADGGIRDHDAETLATLRLGQSRQTIPSLAQVLDLIDGRCPIIVEIKSAPDNLGAAEEAAYSELVNYGGPFAVTSFEPRALTWFRERAPGWLRGQNSGGPRHSPPFEPLWRRLALQYLYDVDDAQPDFVVYDRADLPCFATARLRAGGMPVLTYTVRDRIEMRRLASCTDNVIFEGFRP